MNERERKELARIVADCCKPCSKRIGAWMKSHKPQGTRPKVKGLTARDLAALLGAMPKGASNLVAFRAGHAFKGTNGAVESTDGEAWASVKLTIKGKGEVAVDGRALARWLHAQKSAISLKVAADGIHVHTETPASCVTFPVVLEAHLPKAPKGTAQDMGAIEADALAEAVGAVAFSASDKEMRYALNGIAFDGSDLVTTNGRSLASSRVGLTGLGEKEPTPIFPLYHLRSLLAILRKNGEKEVSVRQVVCKAGHNSKETREYMAFTGPRASFTVREIEGRFPSWREVMPRTKAAATLELDARELAEGLLSLAALTPEDSEERAIKVSVDGAGVTLMHSNGRKETVKVKGKVKGRAGKSAAYINPAYMVDALKTVKGEVRLELRGSEEGVMLKAGSWQYLLMPVSPREPVNA